MFLSGLLLLPRAAFALPSYATQTGLACSVCHSIAFGPALTAVGRDFKLNAYTQGKKSLDYPPLAAYLIASYSNTRKGQDGGAAPHYKNNDNLALDQVSLFYAGRIYGKSGAFVQTTYSDVSRRYTWDNTDIRLADHGTIGGQNIVYGLSLNNNPTVQDLWNSTPAWSFPYVASSLAPVPAAAPVVEGGFAAHVYGLTAYAQIAKILYLEGGAYKTVPFELQGRLGIPANRRLNLQIKGAAPYWRAVVQQTIGSHYGSLGVFGIEPRVQPGGDASAGLDRYTDLGFDGTYQFQNAGPHAVNANATLVHEIQNLSASSALGSAQNGTNHLNTLRLNVQYAYQQTYALSMGFFRINGDADTGLYPPGPVSGSANASPNSRGYIGQLEYVPFGKFNSLWNPFLNVRLGLQYTYYTQFNGGGANYDGAGRSAADNNTLFFYTWLAI